MPNPNARVVLTAEDRASRVIKSFKNEVGGLQGTFSRLNVALGGLVGGGALTLFVKSSLDSADQVQKLSQRIGASTEALSQYRYVADLTGVSFQQLTTGWQRMTRRISEAANGTGEARNALMELGLEAQALNQLKPEQQFEVLADAMMSVEGSSDRVRLAMKLFDSEGVALLQTMQGGSEAIRAMRDEADRLGLTLDQGTADAAANANDALTRMSAATTALGLSMANYLAPVISDVVDWLQTQIPAAIQVVNSAFASAQAGVLEFVSASAGGLASAASFLSSSLPGTGEATDSVSVAMREFAANADHMSVAAERAAERIREQARSTKTVSSALQAGISFNQLYNAELAKSASAGKKVNESRKAATKTIDDARKSIDQYIERLQKEADTYGATTTELAAYELAKLGATQADIARATALRDQIDALEAAAKAEQALASDRERAMEIIGDLDAGSAIRDQIFEVQRLAETFPELADALTEVEFNLQEKWDTIGEGAKDAAEETKSAWEDLGPTFSSAFEDAIVEGKKFSDVMKSLEQDIIRIITRKAITEPLGNAVAGSFGGDGIFGNLLSSVFGGFRASGGPVSANRAYVVGERGPELFVPSNSGEIVPSKAAPAGNTFNFSFSLPSDTVDYRRAGQQVAREASRYLQTAMGAV